MVKEMSVREVARQLGVSRGVVERAYQLPRPPGPKPIGPAESRLF